ERLVWDQEVAGSNPVTPIDCQLGNLKRILLPLCLILAVVAAVKLAAQSPTPANSPTPATNASTNLPEAPPSPSTTPPIEPPSLFTETILPAPIASHKAHLARDLD